MFPFQFYLVVSTHFYSDYVESCASTFVYLNLWWQTKKAKVDSLHNLCSYKLFFCVFYIYIFLVVICTKLSSVYQYWYIELTFQLQINITLISAFEKLQSNDCFLYEEFWTLYYYSHWTRILHGGCVISVMKYRHVVQNSGPIAVLN